MTADAGTRRGNLYDQIFGRDRSGVLDLHAKLVLIEHCFHAIMEIGCVPKEGAVAIFVIVVGRSRPSPVEMAWADIVPRIFLNQTLVQRLLLIF